jgi:hypothetical protein
MKTKADKKDLFDRDPSLFETDYAAVKAIVQTAVNVELFTIPLYMTTLYSIQGVHQITGSNNLYQGRLWPGLAPTFRPGINPSKNIPENEKAFNTIFSVFIEEMLHLQLASNIATAVGVVPVFTQLSPKADNYAWQCYSPESTTIPGIIDLKDCKDFYEGIDYTKIRVKLDELNHTQNDLFLAIEAGEEIAKGRVKEDEKHKYFPVAPFENWEPGDALLMFGSIGQMYQCLWDYLDITYKDAAGEVTTLWEKIYQPAAIQQDIFNTVSSGHPYKEFQEMDTVIEGWLPKRAKELVFRLICAITDQGEGADISKNLRPSFGLQAVKPINQAADEALKADYPNFTDTGKPAASSHAYARHGNGEHDHYERFIDIRTDLECDRIVTWPTWHNKIRPGLNKWQPEDLKTDTYDQNKYPLPKAEEIAGALNRLNDPSGTGDLNNPKRKANYQQFCEIATGAIAGITTVLDQFWANPGVGFPFPSMGGSGDRLMMCWAVFGQLPDLSTGVQPIKDGVLYHACQGLDLNYPNQDDPATCASAEIYHNCRGSNACKAQGGCGFVQQVGQSKACGSSVMSLKTAENLCGPTPPKPAGIIYSAPGDNVCKSFGGCAVPISASQIYPVISGTGDNKVTSGVMELNNFGPRPPHPTQKIPDETIAFNTGDMVHDIGWNAYLEVIKFRKQTPPEKQKPSDIRLAFPPST